MMNRLLILTTLCLTLTLSSCATTQPVTTISPVEQNTQTRLLPVYIATDDTFSKQEIEKCIQGANQILNSTKNNLGIELVIQRWEHMTFPDRDLATMCNAVRTHFWDFDGVSLLMTKHNTVENFVWLFGFGKIKDAVEQHYRKEIILETMDPKILAHAIGHCFIFSHCHSSEGIMRAGVMQDGSTKFSERDRQEILRNKWRIMTVKPDPPPSEEDEPVWSWKVPLWFGTFFLGIPIIW